MTYFKELPNPLCEQFIENALARIAPGDKDKEKKDDKRYEILSPLLVLEILKNKPNLKFKVIKNYLKNRLEVQDRIIR